CQGHASLIGPWYRYESNELGFQIPVSAGWRLTPVPNGLVFAMQYHPQPYVRLAVGRVRLEGTSLEQLSQQETHGSRTHIQKTLCRIDGYDAVKLQGMDDNGPFMDLFVQKAPYCYWIGFAADRKDEWPQYAKTFEIILDGFHFL